jgi:hypothetical protein
VADLLAYFLDKQEGEDSMFLPESLKRELCLDYVDLKL